MRNPAAFLRKHRLVAATLACLAVSFGAIEILRSAFHTLSDANSDSWAAPQHSDESFSDQYRALKSAPHTETPSEAKSIDSAFATGGFIADLIANSGPLLNFERDLIARSAYYDQTAEDALLRGALSDLTVLEEAISQQNQDMDASGLAHLFRNTVEQSMARSGTNARLAGFACGLRICIGELVGDDAQRYPEFNRALLEISQGTIDGMQSSIIRSAEGSTAFRFAFTVETDAGRG